MANPAAVLSILVTANTSQATRGIMRLNTTLGATESSANKAAGAVKTMAKGAALGAGVGIAFAVKKAADFEQQLDSLGAVSNATGRQMDQLRKQAMKAGADTKFSALDAAKAQTELAKGGLNVAQIMKGGLRSALALAAAGEMDLADAASTTANALNLFGLKGKDSIKVADQLAEAANATTADVSDFAMALSQGGSVAKTVGLSFRQTVLWLEALAKSGIKNSDAGTSLKTSLIQLVKPSAKQAELAKELGLNFLDASGHMKTAQGVSEMLREKLGGMTKAQRTAALATLAGTDGVRTLTALYDAGRPKLDKWEQGLKKQGTAADVAAKKQDNLKGKLENLQGSLETAAIAIGTKMLPALTDAAEKVTDVINDPKLSGAEKFDKLGEMAAEAIGKAGPVVAAAAAKLAVVGVRGFFNAFRESPLWLKLVTAAFLINKFGGFQAFKRAGTAAGGAMAEGAATSFAGRMKGRMYAIGKNVIGAMMIAGAADAITRQGISGIGDRWQQFASTVSFGVLPPPKDIQERLGSIAGQIRQWRESGLLKLSDPNDPDNSLIREKDLGDFTARQRRMLAGMAELRNTANRYFGAGTPLISEAWVKPERTAKQLRGLVNEFGRMRSGAVLNVKELRQVTQSNMKAIEQSLGVHSARGKAAVSQNFKSGLQIIKGFMKDGTISTAQGGKEIERLLRVHSGAGKDSLKKNYKSARDFIAQTMRNSKGITAEGMRAIRRIFAQELKLYGLSDEAVKFRLQGKEQSGKTIGAPLVGKQTGGVIVPGRGSGDRVPAMLEPGEVVWNRKAVQSLFGSARAADAVNRMIPRFATGGVAGLKPGISGLVNSVLSRFPGLSVTSTTGGGHAANSYHYRGMAADLASGNYRYMNQAAGWIRKRYGRSLTEGIHNPNLSVSGGRSVPSSFWGSDTWAGHANHIHLAVAGALKALGLSAAKIRKLTVKGGNGAPLETLMQAGLNRVRGAANKRLSALTAVSPDAAFSGNLGGFGKGRLKNLWTRAGGDPGISNLMAAIALAESGGNPQAHNPSGASGLWQILGQIVPGNIYNPLVNAKNAVAKYRSQGLGAWEAYTNGNYSQYLKKGGKVRRVPRRARNNLRDLARGRTTIGDTSEFLANIVDYFEPQLAARETVAKITTPLDFTDDLAVYRDAERIWAGWFEVARSTNDLEGIVRIGGLLESARENIKQITDLAPSVTDDAASVGLLRQLLQEANLRTGVSQAQYGALRDMPTVGGPRFAGGGVAPQVTANANVYVADGMGWLRQFVRTEIDQSNRSVARRPPLPGRGGGLQR